MKRLPITLHLTPAELAQAAEFLDVQRPEGPVTPPDDLAIRLIGCAVLTAGYNTPAARRVLARDVRTFNRKPSTPSRS